MKDEKEKVIVKEDNVDKVSGGYVGRITEDDFLRSNKAPKTVIIGEDELDEASGGYLGRITEDDFLEPEEYDEPAEEEASPAEL